ncbi:MAG: SusC/RagA family TonB-linked outer membrane protein [Bacteroidetes bacterium]|nr:SusC/RagA family TonB-linked outer membrane protein [Bacteroidota bacterium]MBS1932412.1 SusC/RagA family TonB-linked outer membrane protein [Bacteroidota bacterium]
MRKFLCLLTAFLCFVVTLSYAQTKEVTGKVTDATGAPIPGASIKIKGVKTGASADANGAFKIKTPANAVLIISSVGFETKEVEVGNLDAITISLKQSSNSSLNEVVVTALGIKREKKALGYAVSTVGKQDLELRPEGDLARILDGKAAGVDILNTSGLSGSGTNINIRGISTITGNSTPLFIVDGVPFDGGTNNSTTDFTHGTQTSSRFLDLDPNNIESVNILKGLSATTLYGEAGRNGVILITTKNGSTQKSRKKAEITVSQSVFATKAVLPEYNTKYGGGFDLSVGIAYFSNWGGAFQNPPVAVTHPYDKASLNDIFPQFKGTPYYYKYYNSVPRFFRTGLTSNTSLNVAGTTGPVNYNMSYGYTDDKGYLPGNDMYKNNFGIGGTAKLSNRFTASGTFNFVTTNVTSPPTSDSYGNNASNVSIFGNVMYTPTAVDLIGLPYELPTDHSSIYYRSGNDIQNPRWTLNNSFTEDKTTRIFGQMSLAFNIMKGLDLSYRIGLDNYSEFQSYGQNKGGVGSTISTQGFLRTSVGYNTIWDHTFLLTFNKTLGSDFNLDATGGVNSRRYVYSQTGTYSTQQLVYGLINHGNYVSHSDLSENGTELNFDQQTLSVGAFVQATLGFRDFAYLTLGGRNSWFSTVEKNNRSIFYPSAALSYIPTSSIEGLKSSNTLNYWKLRVGYSTSANPPAPYSTRPYLNIATRSFITSGGAAVNTNSNSVALPNPDLKPELLKEVEAGTEAKMFNNRLSIDLTLYYRTADNQILIRSIDPSAGYQSEQVNGGKVTTKGIELNLGFDVVRTKDWKWNLSGIYTIYKSMVSDIPNDIKFINTAGYSNFGTIAENGQPLGVILGSYWVRYNKGGAGNNARIVDPTSGDYVISNDVGVIGNPIPKYKLTGISNLSYKAFTFRMQWDYTCGGDMFASTASALLGRGVTKDTEFDRATPYILPGVDPNGNPNKVQISAAQAYFDNSVTNMGAIAPNETGIYDATCIRLREASLAYNLPEKLLGKTPFGGISISVSGSNLWYYAPNFPKYVHFDPDASGLGVGNGRGMEFLSGPSARRFGASIRVTF